MFTIWFITLCHSLKVYEYCRPEHWSDLTETSEEEKSDIGAEIKNWPSTSSSMSLQSEDWKTMMGEENEYFLFLHIDFTDDSKWMLQKISTWSDLPLLKPSNGKNYGDIRKAHTTVCSNK